MSDLRPGQYKRLGRIAENNPQRAEKVAARMEKRASRTERGKAVAKSASEGKQLARQSRDLMTERRTSRGESMTREEFDKKKSSLNKQVSRDMPLAPSPIPSFLK